MWRVCVQPSAFCKLLFAENKRLIRSIQTSLHTSKEVVLTLGSGKCMSLPDRIIYFAGIFSLQFTGWKMNTFSSSASRVYNFWLCAFWSVDGTRNRWGVKCCIIVIFSFIAFQFFVSGSDGKASQGSSFLMIIPPLQLEFSCFLSSYLWLKPTIQPGTPRKVPCTRLILKKE